MNPLPPLGGPNCTYVRYRTAILDYDPVLACVYMHRFSRSETKLQPCMNEYSHRASRFGTFILRAVLISGLWT